MEQKDIINHTKISGEITKEPILSHTSYEENFYEVTMKVDRFSDSSDTLTSIISEKLIDISKLTIGTFISIDGELRTYNIIENKTNKLKIVVFAKNIKILTEKQVLNDVHFVGYICKKPIYRTTPLGREICDVIVAINRNYHKSSYIPVIGWGRNAKYLGDLEVGQKIECFGRFQSREYNKKIDDQSVKKVAYEISLSKVKKIEEN